MEIQELYLKHYGKFDNHRIRLKPGINIIYGGNEAGKTTIHSFIRAMLYGLSRGRGKAAKTDEYQVRQPWDSPGAFLGSMRVREGDEVYRIDRCFDRSAQPLAVTCETQAREAAQPQQALDALLGGISETAFVNTVFIPQAQAETDEALAQELQRYMVNSDSTMDAQLDLTQALQSLRKKKKQFEQKRKKEEEQLEAQIAGKQAQAEQIRAELEMLRRQERMLGAALPARRDEDEAEEFDEDYEDDGPVRGRGILEALMLLAGVFALLGAVFLTDLNIRIFLGVFAALFLLLIVPVHLLLGGRTAPKCGEAQADSEQGRYVQEEMRSREAAYRKLQDELEQLYHSHVGQSGADTEIDALTLAIDRICELSSGIYERTGGALGRRASEILSELTGGAYTSMILDETAAVRIHTPSRVLGLHQVSGGTLQQIYFALRMAAGELLGEGRSLPVILDETFAMYDDERLAAALRWLKKSGRQVILFTCQKRERELLETLA